MVKTAFAASTLKSFIDRIERLDGERASISEDITAVFSEAKGSGFDTKVMRKVIALRKMDAADRQEMGAILDLYLDAMGMNGLPLGDYAEKMQADQAAQAAA